MAQPNATKAGTSSERNELALVICLKKTPVSSSSSCKGAYVHTTHKEDLRGEKKGRKKATLSVLHY